MNKNPIVIINNEKIFRQDKDFYCDNLGIKELPEGLKDAHQVQFIARESKKKRNHKIELDNIKAGKNIFNFLFYIFKSLKIKNTNYLIVDITPYTFFCFLILFIFRKKIFLYLRSSGHEEWRHILGPWTVWIFHIMYKIITSGSKVIVNNSRLYNKECHLINSSRLDDQWFKGHKEVNLDKIKLLYVGRINPEKGIYDFVKIFDQIALDAEFSIVGDPKNLKIENKNINLLGYISDSKKLIDIYDSHNIIVLPSYTEGEPHILDECLVRKRPIIIFEDIAYIAKNKNGIFISRRDANSFKTNVQYIIENYFAIQKNMEKNKFLTKKDMIKQISNIII